MTSYRQPLQGVRQETTTHAGLWLDKYIPGYDQEVDGQKPQKWLVDAVARIPMPDLYQQFYARWSATLLQAGVVCKKAIVQGRLSIGLGGEGVLETAVTLHRTYGVPYIPGSALKGLAASFARNHLAEDAWGKASDAYRTMFGDTESAGYLTFFDALYVPASGFQEKALWADIITVHHPNYYQGNEPPADWDSPTPVPFLTATGSYLIAIGGVSAWVERAFEILALALAEEGVGAKTSSGYGRLWIEGMEPQTPNVPVPTDEPYALVRQRLLAEAPPDRQRGTVVSTQRGGDMGRINPARGGSEVFAHYSQIHPIGGKFSEGQVVEYKLGKDKQGRIQANNVRILLNPY